MKLVALLSFFVLLFATAQASSKMTKTKVTNAHRLAQGLPPLVPRKLFSPCPSDEVGAFVVFLLVEFLSVCLNS